MHYNGNLPENWGRGCYNGAFYTGFPQTQGTQGKPQGRHFLSGYSGEISGEVRFLAKSQGQLQSGWFLVGLFSV